jgi:SAM-dependent methyltransferase
MKPQPHYTFGDSDVAAERLVLLSRAFEPSSARLLESLAPRSSPHARAVDLGCGPGLTTQMLHHAVHAGQTWGLDASERLVARARAQLGGELSFAVHDITLAPYPVTDVDLFYARYVLTHLASPRDVLLACASAGRRGSVLVLEENCALQSTDPLFEGYYARVGRLQSHYGQNQYVGEGLAAMAEGTPWRLQRFERTRIVLDARIMARLHAMNVRTWRTDAFATAAFSDAAIDAMTAELDDVAEGRRASPEVTCVMGQVVLGLE